MAGSKKTSAVVSHISEGGSSQGSEMEASETTTLLGNPETQPAEDQRSDSDESTPRWDGFDDFEGLPWWRKPSVRSNSM